MEVQIEQMTKEDREEIIGYGIKRAKVILGSALITIMMGWLLKITCQSIIFLLCLSVLRKYAGGYHADTEKRCFAISFVMVLTALFCIKFMRCDIGWQIVGQTISLFIILFLAPVENKNHMLDQDEKMKYGIKTRIIVIMLYVIYIFFCTINRQDIMVSIEMVYLILTFSLILGSVKNRKEGIVNS